jgi:hypothetical protein
MFVCVFVCILPHIGTLNVDASSHKCMYICTCMLHPYWLWGGDYRHLSSLRLNFLLSSNVQGKKWPSFSGFLGCSVFVIESYSEKMSFCTCVCILNVHVHYLYAYLHR